MSKEVERYTFICDVENDEYVRASDYDALLEENQRLESAWKVDVLNRKDELIAKQEKENDRVKAERNALLAERDRLRKALEQIENANWSSSETATDFAISQAKGLLIRKMKRIASAALQGEQP
ncbi:MAG: hypothetical protein E2594_17035 [Pseudomonas sp.]|nr:hypothetical protein [Pseudomonas sp.]